MSNKTNGVQMSQKDYLKKYLNKGDKDKTKKKKPVKKEHKRVEIIDDDIGIQTKVDDNDLLFLHGSDDEYAPQIAEFIDERPAELKALEKYKHSDNWKAIGENNLVNSEMDQSSHRKGEMSVEKENSKKQTTTSGGNKKDTTTAKPEKTKRKVHGKRGDIVLPASKYSPSNDPNYREGNDLPPKINWKAPGDSSKQQQANETKSSPMKKPSKKEPVKSSAEKKTSSQGESKNLDNKKSKASSSSKTRSESVSSKSKKDKEYLSPPLRNRTNRGRGEETGNFLSELDDSVLHMRNESPLPFDYDGCHRGFNNRRGWNREGGNNRFRRSFSPRRNRNDDNLMFDEPFAQEDLRNRINRKERGGFQRRDTGPPIRYREGKRFDNFQDFRRDRNIPPLVDNYRGGGPQNFNSGNNYRKRRMDHHNVDDIPPRRQRGEYHDRPIDFEFDNRDNNRFHRNRQQKDFSRNDEFNKYNEQRVKRTLSRSPSRNRKQFSGSRDKHPKDFEIERSMDRDPHLRPRKMLDGKKSGLQHAKNLREEMDDLSRNEDRYFEQLGSEITGKHAAPIMRDRKTGKLRDLEEEKYYEAQKRKQDDVTKEKYYRWGKGLKQIEDAEEKHDSDLREMAKPFARYADDDDLERYYKNQNRDGDTMIDYIRQRKHKEESSLNKNPERMVYRGPYPPNRFNIRPGYRWDGVDRSNGYESKYFETQSRRKAVEEEAYKWSTADM